MYRFDYASAEPQAAAHAPEAIGEPDHTLQAPPIDAVYTWVDDSDPTWRSLSQTKSGHTSSLGAYASDSHSDDATSDRRFRNFDELKFSLLTMGRYASWIRNIFIVVCCETQRPKWLGELPIGLVAKVKFVQHHDIFPSGVLAKGEISFSSDAIEANLHRIPGLAEHFIYLNDDMMFGHPVTPGDFFTPAASASGQLPRVAFQDAWGLDWMREPVESTEAYVTALYNMYYLLDERYGYEPRKRVIHQALPLTIAAFKRMHELFPTPLRRTMLHAYRTNDDVIPHHLALWIAMYEGKAVRLHVADYPTAALIQLNEAAGQNARPLTSILYGHHRLLCINDGINASNAAQGALQDVATQIKHFFHRLTSFADHGAEAEPPKPTLTSREEALAVDALTHVRGSPEVIFAVNTGREMHEERARPMHQTWCRDVGACIFFSDDVNEARAPVTWKLDAQLAANESIDCTIPGGDHDPNPSEMTRQVYSTAQLRFLPAIATVRSWILNNVAGKFGSIKWLVVVDDDTYVFYRNLLEVLSGLDHRQPVRPAPRTSLLQHDESCHVGMMAYKWQTPFEAARRSVCAIVSLCVVATPRRCTLETCLQGLGTTLFSPGGTARRRLDSRGRAWTPVAPSSSEAEARFSRWVH